MILTSKGTKVRRNQRAILLCKRKNNSYASLLNESVDNRLIQHNDSDSNDSYSLFDLNDYKM